MRKTILATFAILAFAVSATASAWHYRPYSYTVTHDTSTSSGSISQGSSVSAGSISGATTTGTGVASTYGIANMSAATTGGVISGSGVAGVEGTTEVAGHTESQTYVSGAGAAGSLAGGEAEANVWGSAEFEQGSHQHTCYSRYYGCSGPYNFEYDSNGEAEIVAGSKGKAWSATGSIGSGSGIAVNGFEAYGDAAAEAYVGDEGDYGDDDYDSSSTSADVETASGAYTYTLEVGKAIGNTKAKGWGFGSASAYTVLGDDD